MEGCVCQAKSAESKLEASVVQFFQNRKKYLNTVISHTWEPRIKQGKDLLISSECWGIQKLTRSPS